MVVKSKTIAITSTELEKTKQKIKTRFKELKQDNNLSELELKENYNKFQNKANKIDEKLEFLVKKIENEVFKIVKDNDVIGVCLAIDFISIQGMRFINDIECQKIATFLGYKHYLIQPDFNWLSIYFYNNKDVFDIGEEALL